MCHIQASDLLAAVRVFAQFHFIPLKSDGIKGLVLRRELPAISILIEAETVAVGDLTKVQPVHGEEMRSEHRPLRYTMTDGHQDSTAASASGVPPH